MKTRLIWKIEEVGGLNNEILESYVTINLTEK